MNIKEYLVERKGWVEAALSHSIDDSNVPETIRKSMLYSLEAGGKRLRPILVMAGAEAVGGTAERVLSAAVAVEMIHTFSLIHDDLPSMDDDSLRRGKPTNHVVFGEATAILAGDGLIAEAFYVLSEPRSGCDCRLQMETIRDIAAATGGRGMTGGQIIDMEAEGHLISESELNRLHICKTGALISASVQAGARLCNAKPEQLTLLGKYGDAIGLAFQIADDILDIEGDEKLLGKDIGSDEENEKSTYPAILGMDASKAKAVELVDQAVSLLSTFDHRAEPLRLIAKYIIERDR